MTETQSQVELGTFVVKDNLVDRRQLVIGQRNSFVAEVRQGLSVNESLILHPTEKIKQGSCVKSQQTEQSQHVPNLFDLPLTFVAQVLSRSDNLC